MKNITNTFPFIQQLDVMDCGPTCIQMISQYFGKKPRIESLRELCGKSQQGDTLFGINKAREKLGFRTLPAKLDFELLRSQAKLPCIEHWNEEHYVVVYKIKKKTVCIADPGKGKIEVTYDVFKRYWANYEHQGIALFIEPTENFHSQKDDVGSSKSSGKISYYVSTFKPYFTQIGMGVILSALLSLIFPFLTQSLVDTGIGNSDIDFVYIILFAQLFIFVGRTASDFIRSRLVTHIGARVNFIILSDFISKLLKLPLNYFNNSNLGDTLQRVSDHQKIEDFLTSNAVSTIFSFFQLIVFSFILISYSLSIFFVFIIGSCFSIIWLLLFLNKRKALDYQSFIHQSSNQSSVVQLVHGMPEIRLNQAESKLRWKWEKIQAELFNLKLKSLAIEQYQSAGTLFVNEGKNILITFIAAKQVIDGEMTLGMLLAITYILGQLNSPIEQIQHFVKSFQDAKISFDRLNEIQTLRDEVDYSKGKLLTKIPEKGINIKDLSFKYSIHSKHNVLDKITLSIPYKKTTAIVGASGSGKTTLLKLLLKFHLIDDGFIGIGNQNLNDTCPDSWRAACGAVLQEGFVFSDSISKNIAVGDIDLDIDRIIHAAKTASIHDEIMNLPQKYKTKIGQEGVRLSGGQVQRILIARAIYKNPDFLFFDEATSALDANNEKRILENLKYIFHGRTVVVIAHRLSTVKNADKIVVLDNGKVVEEGTHTELSRQKGAYFDLVKNQLELGS